MFKRIIVLILGVLLLSAEVFAENTPAAFLPEQTYQFAPLLEGTEVVHDFILQNKGTAPLDIINLKSG